MSLAFQTSPTKSPKLTSRVKDSDVKTTELESRLAERLKDCDDRITRLQQPKSAPAQSSTADNAPQRLTSAASKRPAKSERDSNREKRSRTEQSDSPPIEAPSSAQPSESSLNIAGWPKRVLGVGPSGSDERYEVPQQVIGLVRHLVQACVAKQRGPDTGAKSCLSRRAKRHNSGWLPGHTKNLTACRLCVKEGIICARSGADCITVLPLPSEIIEDGCEPGQERYYVLDPTRRKAFSGKIKALYTTVIT